MQMPAACSSFRAISDKATSETFWVLAFSIYNQVGTVLLHNSLTPSNLSAAENFIISKKETEMANHIVLLAFVAMTYSLVIAFEPKPLQDFCIADTTSSGLYQIIEIFYFCLNKLCLHSRILNFCVHQFVYSDKSEWLALLGLQASTSWPFLFRRTSHPWKHLKSSRC